MKQKFQRWMGICLALAMIVGFLPMSVKPVEAAGDNDSLHLSKSIELQADGDYKITLEAYATGQDKITTTTKAVPLDIVLVLDQSGSMGSNNISSYSYTARTSQEYSYSDFNSWESKKYYYKDGDQYYLVESKSEGSWGSKKYYLTYNKNGTTYYLYGTEASTTKQGKSSYNTTIWSGVLYERQTTSTKKRLDALKDAVTNFVTTVEKKAAADKVDHRIAIVGFASKDDHGYNTEVLSVSGKNSGTVGVKYSSATNDTYKNAFQDTTTSDGNTMLSNAINALAAEGATRADLGMEMAYKILDNNAKKNDAGRKRLVIMFTDGEPNNQNGFDNNVADATIAKAKDIKDGTKGNATVYTIGIFDGANPDTSITQASQVNQYMHFVSTNYPTASSLSNYGTGSNAGYYKAASDTATLNSIFESISNSEISSGTSVTLTAESVLRDIIATQFEVKEGTTADVVKVYTAESNTVTDGTITWNDRVPATETTVSVSGRTVDVKGFDYSENYVTTNHPGKKLIVEVLVNGLTTGTDMYSNNPESGIYDKEGNDGILVQAFERPQVTIDEYNYVLDFGKPVTVDNDDFGVSSTTILNGYKAAPSSATSVTKAYGTYSRENDTITYTPQKINWDGIDSAFAFGQRKDESAYKWFGVNFIPASSVYFEDNFNVSVDNSIENAEARIVYSGSCETVNDDVDQTRTDGIDDNKQSSGNNSYGTDSSYDNDSKYSGGSATQMVSEDSIATATFTFTGTGVDIYSRTDNTTGVVRATVYNEDGDIVKMQRVDTLYDNGSDTAGDNGITGGNDGELYQIPTISLNLGSRAKYKVKLQVAYKTTQVDRCTYYLDGIRIYNPLGEVPDGIAGKEYEKANENGAAVVRLRDILLGLTELKDIANNSITDTTENTGIAFIDSVKGKQENETVVLDVTGLQAYKEYGPKNEVYLAKGNAITFKVNKDYGTDKSKILIGMKSPTGQPAKVEYTSGNTVATKVLKTATDMYYEITPTDEGYITIKNTGNALVALTKLKMTQVKTNNNKGLIKVSTDVLNYTAAAFSEGSFVTEKVDNTAGIPVTSNNNAQVPVEITGEVDVKIQNGTSSEAQNVAVSEGANVWNSVSRSVAAYIKSTK